MYPELKPPRTPYTFDRVARIVISLISIAGAILVLDYLKGALLPFFIACIAAYLLEPAVKFNKRLFRLKKRFIPVLLTLAEAVAITALICFTALPYIIDETSQMVEIIHDFASHNLTLPYLSGNIHDFIRDNVDFDRVAALLSHEEWIELGRNAVVSSWGVLSSGIGMVISALGWLIVVLYIFFIMLDYDRIMTGFRHLVPIAHRRRVFRIGRDLKDAMNRYFRGQVLIAFLVGLLFSAGFLIIGLPMAVVFGLFIGILNLVPYLQLFSIPIALFLCLVDTAGSGISFWLIFSETMAVYCVVQCVQDLVLTPRIMGKAMGLNPAVILLSLSVWGTLLGFLGLIIALPLTTLLLSYYDTYIINRCKNPDCKE